MLLAQQNVSKKKKKTISKHNHLVGDEPDLHVGLRIQNSLVREGLVSDFVQRIARVRDKLAKEDLHVIDGKIKRTGTWCRIRIFFPSRHFHDKRLPDFHIKPFNVPD